MLFSPHLGPFLDPPLAVGVARLVVPGIEMEEELLRS